MSKKQDEPAGSMLPLPLQFLAAWLAVWLGRVLQQEVDYLMAENRVLRERRGNKRLRLTVAERRRLAVQQTCAAGGACFLCHCGKPGDSGSIPANLYPMNQGYPNLEKLMRIRLFGLIALLGCGCTHMAYQITSDEACGGVPFLPIESLDVVKLSYQQTWLELRVDGVFKRAGASGASPLARDAAPAPTDKKTIDVNTAVEADLAAIPELRPFTKKIVANRPYAELADLTAKHVLTEALFKKVSKRLTVVKLLRSEDKDGTFTRTVVAYTHDLESTPGDADLAGGIYVAFAKETEGGKAWNVSAGEILSNVDGKKLTLSEPPLVSPDTLPGMLKLVGQERSRTQAPAARPLYFNIRVPSGGTVSGEIDLAANGTMTKSSSQVQDQLPGAVASAASSVASAALGSTALNTMAAHFFAPAAAPALQAVGAPTVQKVDLTLTWIRRIYTVAITRPAGTPESSCGTLASLLKFPVQPGAQPGTTQADSCRAGVSIETKRGGDDGKAKSAKDDDSIRINGSITLPKPAGAGAKGKDDSPN